MNNKRYTVLGVSVLILSTLIFTFVVMFSIFLLSDITRPDLTAALSSSYISTETGILEENPEPAVIKNDVTPEEKKGEIKVDEDRKILNVGKTLSSTEIEEIEEKYSVEFTSDTPKNGVYVINTTEESNTTTLTTDLKAQVETDIPVKMTADRIDWGISRIGADKVWDKTTGSGIKVAVIDTGVQLTHPDLSSNITTGYDFVNNDSDASDDNGHGTHVAGIIAAIQNSAGTIGAANKARIMPVKVLNNQGYGYLSDVAKGIYYAADNGARVINLSLGASTDSLTLKNAIAYAAGKGVIIAAAAGNDYGKTCSYPAAYPGAICVVATDSYNKLASFSNIGGELAAPGVSNYSTYLGSTYKYMSGTSMATPHVAGAAAVVISYCSTCTSSQIRTILRENAVDLGVVGQDGVFGYGLVDLVASINSLTPETATEEPTTTPETEEPTTSQSTTPPKKAISQILSITEPETNTARRYTPTQVGDITIKFKLEPISETSKLQKVILTLNNEKLYEGTQQEDEYIVEEEKLDHSQNWVRVTAYFSDGTKSTDSITIDLTKIKGRSTSGKSIKGVSTFIDFRYFLFGW